MRLKILNGVVLRFFSIKFKMLFFFNLEMHTFISNWIRLISVNTQQAMSAPYDLDITDHNPSHNHVTKTSENLLEFSWGREMKYLRESIY